VRVPTSSRKVDKLLVGELVGFAVIIGILLFLPGLGASNRIIFLGVVCVIWSIVAYGLFVPFALAGQMTVAAITVWAAASFSVALAANNWDWNLNLLIPLGVVAGAIAGGVFALPVLRTSGHYFIVVTFAIAALGVQVGQNWETIDPDNSGITVGIRPELFGWQLQGREDVMKVASACLAVVFVGVVLLRRSRFGKRLAAVRENEALASTVGAPVKLYKWTALAIGGAIIGLAAPLQVIFLRHIQIGEFGIGPGITIVVILVLGGRRYVLGPIIGALFWYLAPELIGVSPLVGQALFGALLALVIIIAPDGLVSGVVSLVRWLGRITGIVKRPEPTHAEPVDVDAFAPSQTATDIPADVR
jgi:branched-chain amino acid transport system permease protein